MPDNSFFTVLLYVIGALVAGAAGLFALGMFVEAHKHFNRWLIPLISPLLLLATGLGVLLSRRDITYAETEIGTFDLNMGESQVWMLRLATLVVLGICTAAFISASQRHEPAIKQGRSLFFAFLVFFITNNVLNNLLGAHPVIDQKLAYAAAIFAAVFVHRNKDMTPLIDATKWGLLLFMVVSCLAAVLKPSLAIQPYADGMLPGISLRMWGLGSNPNSIGPMALVLFLLLLHKPFASRFFQFSACAVALLVLALAQSKTTWVAALLAVPALWWGKSLHAEAFRSGGPMMHYRGRNMMRPMLLSLLGLAAALAFMYATMHTDQVMRLAQERQVTTLTGRTEIWGAAIRTWQENPLFGYGSSAWDPAFRDRIGMDFAYSAHNQFLQSLSTAGAAGLAGLLVYLLILARYAIASCVATRGLSIALAATVFVRLFTEVPLNIDGVFSGDFITHLLLFSVIVAKGRLPVRAYVVRPGYSPLHHFPQQ